MQPPCDLLKPIDGQIIRPAKILLAQLLSRAPIGIPVALAPLAAFLACGVGAILPVEAKGGEFGQPGKPGGAVWDQGEALCALIVRPGIGPRGGRPTQRSGCFRHRMSPCRSTSALLPNTRYPESSRS